MKISSEQLVLECVRPTESHARLIMQWRNDPDTLRFSFHTQPKVWSSFFPEFLRDYFCFSSLPPLFVVYNGTRVAFLRFKPVIHPTGSSRKCAEISINVSPESRRQGIGLASLMIAQEWIQQQGYSDLYAEVKLDNTISQKAFEQAGFIRLSDGVKEIEDSDEKIPICRYFVELVPELTAEKPVFIIAEAGSNWRMGTFERDLEMAKSLIDAAADAKADAIKFQTFRPETIYVPNAGKSDYLAEVGIQKEIRDIFIDLAMPYEMIPLLAEYCASKRVQFMSTPFSIDDFKAVDPYVKIHKIASYEIGHIHLIELAARSKKPVLLSTGAATEEEIAWAVNTFFDFGGERLTLLQCTACYPAEEDTLHLQAIPWLKQRFKVEVGLSDHSRSPFEAPIAAVALGAKVIEKHFTLSNQLPGPDHAFAITPPELSELVKGVRLTEQMLGWSVKDIDPSEIELRHFARRGIQALQPIKKGDIFKENLNMAILRPGKQPLGVHPKYISEIEGKKALHSIALGAGLKRGDWQK
jgi:sialic acid synthase SpsE/RimJ/RimL family protein N-acetyltransferase